MTHPTLSIVAPVYNEEEILPEFYARVSEVMTKLDITWELILVNDGSRDRSMEIMFSIAAEDDHVRVVNFARNFGHQVAVTAGIDHAEGDAVILIDADLQDPPEVIGDMLQKWREGYDVVYAVREQREGESWFKLTTAKLFYRMLYRITDVDIPVDTGDFRLMDAKVAQVLRDMREHNRFIRGMTSWVGFRQTGVKYVRHARKAGETKYPLRKMLRFALDAVTGFSYFPLQVMVYLAGFLGILAIVVAIVISILRLTQGPDFFGGQATTIILLLLLSSFQLFFLFIIGQYVARIYDETRDRPLYVVASRRGFPEQNGSAAPTRHGRTHKPEVEQVAD
ncbi:MAG: glycosyltransferase family 2 protein [Anaerolineae bacterium]|nr:glycosyltransferase family 2 protein [Anaerolineae bacterium]MCA9893766.1 glycosyltransferase family 2 protein [Anaerolineae bacterium]